MYMDAAPAFLELVCQSWAEGGERGEGGPVPVPVPLSLARAFSLSLSLSLTHTHVVSHLTHTLSLATMLQGGKTGLTAIFVSFYFLISVFFAPLLASVPPWATVSQCNQ